MVAAVVMVLVVLMAVAPWRSIGSRIQTRACHRIPVRPDNRPRTAPQTSPIEAQYGSASRALNACDANHMASLLSAS